MRKPWHDIPLGDKVPQVIPVYIEIPKGSSTKYEIDKEHGLLKLDRFLYSAVHYPGDYGFMPKTLGGDGDALDIMIYTQGSVLPHTLADVRPIGVIRMVDTGEQDDKIVCVYVKEPMSNGIEEMKDLPKHFIDQTKNFLETYKLLENKKVKVTGILGKSEAYRLILEGVKSYKKKFGK